MSKTKTNDGRRLDKHLSPNTLNRTKVTHDEILRMLFLLSIHDGGFEDQIESLKKKWIAWVRVVGK